MKKDILTDRYIVKPKVSVLVVTYNQEKFISDTLESILSDGYENLEIVISDDASTDSTPVLLKNYSERYPEKIKLICNQKNEGITKNCNKALFACTGDYIALFAGDDLFLPGKITAQVSEFLKDPEVVLCYHSVETFDSETNKTLEVAYTNNKKDVKTIADIIIQGGIAAPCSLMVKKDAIPKEGYDIRLPTVSDWLFQLEVAQKGKIAKVNGVYARYRKHKKGTSKRTFELLQETLLTLDLFLEKCPDQKNLAEVCKIGKARYLAGEAFRQINLNPTLAHDLALQAKELNPKKFSLRILVLICFIFSKSKLLTMVLTPVLQKAKYLIKRAKFV